MYSRFLKKVAEQWSSNFIVFLVDDCLYWMFENVYPQNTNVIKYSLRHFLNHFDYHCNVSMLMVYLGISYNDIYIDYYLKTTKTTRDNTIVINWKGNAENVNEKNNRSMPLVQLISLFKIKNIRWVTVQKNITNDEHKLLKKYNVEILNVDNGENAFQDTLELFKTVKLVITTDTSLAHVAGTSDTPCCVMLTTGCDWRWTQDTITNWYPNVKLVRQKNMNWSNVIEEIKNIVSN
jgi:ADP-heptose:LPS heptosyltransferase